MSEKKIELAKKYPFVPQQVAKEAFVFEVLEEIAAFQDRALKEGTVLATLEDIQSSSNILMPFSPTRNKNLAYILELLYKNCSDHIKQIYTFKFFVDRESKKLDIDEIIEYSLSISQEKITELQIQRDSVSRESLLLLLENFRLFNLTQLLKKGKNKNHLSFLIKEELGKNIFTFKYFSLDKNSFEATEDYCFHRKNYEAVSQKLSIDHMHDIIEAHNAPINRRLNKFGILNSTVSDYRDNKLDYILNILMNEISSSLDKKDLIEVKNFHSLRNCMQKVNRIIDPITTHAHDILNYIKKNTFARIIDLASLFTDVTDVEIFNWSEGSRYENNLFNFEDIHSIKYIFETRAYMARIINLHQLVLFKEQQLNTMPHLERQDTINQFELFCNAGKHLLLNEDEALKLLKSQDNLNTLKKIIGDNDAYQLKMKQTIEEVETIEEKSSLIKRIIVVILSIFTGKNSSVYKKGYSSQSEASYHEASTETGASKHKKKRVMSSEARDLFTKIQSSRSMIAPLSDHIELIPENEIKVDALIQELRAHKVKIVIPIFNARKNLYPIRSRNLLIPDVEYLLVDPEITKTPDEIRNFTESLTRVKVKDETIPNNTLFNIEKYLMNIHRKNRAVSKKKK